MAEHAAKASANRAALLFYAAGALLPFPAALGTGGSDSVDRLIDPEPPRAKFILSTSGFDDAPVQVKLNGRTVINTAVEGAPTGVGLLVRLGEHRLSASAGAAEADAVVRELHVSIYFDPAADQISFEARTESFSD